MPVSDDSQTSSSCRYEFSQGFKVGVVCYNLPCQVAAEAHDAPKPKGGLIDVDSNRRSQGETGSLVTSYLLDLAESINELSEREGAINYLDAHLG